MRLNNKKIIVTGSARGIGEAAVRAFAAAGATVTAMDINAEVGARVARDASRDKPVSFRTVDVADRGQVETAFAEATEAMAGLDALVNVAGIQTFAPVNDIPSDLLHRIMSVNFYGTVHTNAAAYAAMKPHRSGAIINFGSESGLTAELDNSAYGASKAAVHAWTRSVARDWGPDGIRVNAVLPYVVTPLYAEFRAQLTPEALAAHDDDTRKQIPLGGKFGDPATDLAPVLVFLASDDSRFITGQLLPVDGGLISVR